MECPKLEACPFFNDRMPAVENLLKDQYCLSPDHVRCARFRIAEARGREAVPPNMFPNQTLEADEILGS